ncbi:MAG: hypothetical protein ABFD18_06095 [Syntrophomonas sp.]
MSKRPSLFHQLLTSLRGQECFGKSKYKAKQIAITEAHAQGKSGFGVAPEGVFSVVTFAGYRQVCHQFAGWCTENNYARTTEEAREYVGQYIQERIDRGLSPWTIQRDRSALRKAYQDPELASEVNVPRRRLKDIKRSRHPVAMDRDFNEERHRDLVDFCKATGLRRHELVDVRPKDVYWHNGRLIAYVSQGKGGKDREVTVVRGMENRVLEIINGKDPEKPIFRHITSKMDVHSYRRKYSFARQDQATEIDVSHDLGHNRIDVIRCHYSKLK